MNRSSIPRTVCRLIGASILIAMTGSIAPPPPAFAPNPVGSDPTDLPAAAKLTWTRPVDGIRVRLTSGHPTVKSGQPFELEFKMENCDDRTRSVLLPMVRQTMLPLAKAAAQKSATGAGDLMITADQISGDPAPPLTLRLQETQVQYGSFGLPGGSQIWITIGVNPPGTPPPQTPVRFINPKANQIGGPMLHFQESTAFPALVRPGKYRLIATFTAGLNGNGRMRSFGDDDSTQWIGRIESEPIELEVIPADAPK